MNTRNSYFYDGIPVEVESSPAYQTGLKNFKNTTAKGLFCPPLRRLSKASGIIGARPQYTLQTIYGQMRSK